MEKRFSIGVLLESFRLPMQQAVEQARAVGVQGVQAYVHNLTAVQQKELYTLLKDNGLKLSAVCGDLGHGFGDPEFNPDLIERSKRILDTAKQLGTDIVTTHIGVVPTDPRHPRYRIMQDACGELAQYADSINSHFAVETGPETAETLCAFLDSLNSTGVAVNLDPANLVMVTGDDPVRAVYTLKKYIVHTHAKDGKKLLDRDPEIIYHIVKPLEPVTDHAFIELPLGEGNVPFPEYLDALQEIGYKGFLTIEREVGANPADDIRKAADYLRQLI
ncbi:MAG: sugar phosphate isomerase/epimerase [Clostridia bacterium]|nr:sugar phosphate isomerase/epimerase [Clostridia bacterium]